MVDHFYTQNKALALLFCKHNTWRALLFMLSLLSRFASDSESAVLCVNSCNYLFAHIRRSICDRRAMH